MTRAITLSLLLFPAIAVAQAQPPHQTQTRQATPNNPLYWSVDLIINNYVRQLGAAYHLSPEQEEYTRNLTGQRVKRFLTDYEKDVRWMAAEMMNYKLAGQVPPPEIAKVWGERAREILPAIRAEIMEGNAKWREILNDDQKALHDRDIDALTKQFDTWSKMADRWAEGNIAPADFEAPGQLSRQPRTMRPNEDAWEFFVNSFIAMYSLDEGQQQSARSILRESREQAAHYREAHKAEFAELDAADKAITQSPASSDPDEIKKKQEAARVRMEKRRDLEKPISELFVRLKSRLEELPTAEQRRSREQAAAKLAALARKSATRPAIAVLSSQPTTAADASK